MAQRVFSSVTVCGSFPQLTLGPLSEFAHHEGRPLIQRLAGHKKGNLANRAAGQAIVDAQIAAFLNDAAINWHPPDLTVTARSDGYDALLGLLPGLVWAHYLPPGPTTARWKRVIALRNEGAPYPQPPVSQGAGNPCTNSRQWIQNNPVLDRGINDNRLLCLDLDLWQ